MSGSGVPAAAGPLVRVGSVSDLEALRPLWRRFYDDQVARGMRMTVPANGFDEWVASLGPMIGRFGCVVLCETSGAVGGFVAGRVRNLPRHFGGGTAGYISEVWVEPHLRGQGVGAAMVEAAIAWFGGQGIRRVELQVVATNASAKRLYERLGFVEDLVQMVRL